MEFKQGVGFLSYYVTEVVAESVQFLEPRNAKDNRSEDGLLGAAPRDNYGSYGQNLNQNQDQQHSGNYTRENDNPFANGGKTIDISDDLPF